MYWIVNASQVERYVQVLAAGYGPVLILNVVFGTLNTPIDCIGNVTRNLAIKSLKYNSSSRNRWSLPESETRIEYGNKLTVWCKGHYRVNVYWLAIWPNDSDILVRQSLPMLV